jgi:hypothetical protein
MNPVMVTITGADDVVDPRDLLLMSWEFPFVEWGILWSAKMRGTPRYPTLDWISAFTRAALNGRRNPMRTSLHLCGATARSAVDGATFSEAWSFCRLQINGYMPGRPLGLHNFIEYEPGQGLEVILQCRSEDTLQQVADDAASLGPNASVLFDPSGGRGIEPFRWATTPFGCRLGFAGGIGPDNVLDVIRDIGPRDPYWIDMESGVRTDDRFDLAKVRRVLEQIAEQRARAA